MIVHWPMSGYISQSLPMRNSARSWPNGHRVSFRWESQPRLTRIGITEGWEIYEAFRADEDLIAYADNGYGEKILTAQKGDIIHRQVFKFAGGVKITEPPPEGKLKMKISQS